MSENGTAAAEGDEDPAEGGSDIAQLREEITDLSSAVTTLRESHEARGQRLDELEERLADHQRRAEREREQIAAQSLAEFADRMLSVKDSLDNVLGMGELDDDTERQISLVRKQFENSFTSGEIERIDTDGAFDASRHKMIEQRQTDEYDEGEIVEELDAGYAVGDRVLRPARVVVAKSD